MQSTSVLLVSIDGLRPDAVNERTTPTICQLKRDGSCAVNARTVMPSITLPAHLSMLRGVDPARHGVTTNVYQPPARQVPSLFDMAKENGKRTGFFYNWEQLRDLSAPGGLDVSVMFGDCESPEMDRLVAKTTADWLSRESLDLVMVYLGWPDVSAHRHGWMSEPYLEAISNADACMKIILEGIGSNSNEKEWVVLATSDHGGHGKSHGYDMDEDMCIPWILSGANVKRGVELTEPVFIYDTCPTLSHILGVPASSEWEGRVVAEALLSDGA